LAATVGALLADPDRAHRLGAAGRRWMQEDWSWPARVTQLHGMLAGRPAPYRPGTPGRSDPAPDHDQRLRP
jgi:phosphatidyl-myo-inositol dimannoside synthase